MRQRGKKHITDSRWWQYLLSAIIALHSSLITLSAQESQTAYNFLRLPVSAHASALGGENISLADDDWEELCLIHCTATVLAVVTIMFALTPLLISRSDKFLAGDDGNPLGRKICFPVIVFFARPRSQTSRQENSGQRTSVSEEHSPTV